MSNNIKVAIKVRPLLAKEARNNVEEQWTVTQNAIVSKSPLQGSVHYFDHVFGKESTNRQVFEIMANPIVKQCLKGYNGTIFAYGQTSSGKTHTMIGNNIDPGITALAVRQLFEENESDRTFMIRVGYFEIYNEKVYDLLNDRKQVTINQNGDNDVRLTNKEEIVSDSDTILNILTQGNRLRKAAQTNMNELSSRSHAIFRIIIESEDANGNGPVRVSYLNLVDLAGSEKATDANNETRLKEGNDINKSLLHLGICIRALSEGQRFVDVRSSKLTRILQASLGGNAYTAIVCNITPGAIDETASTLGFANQARAITNKAKCNEVYSPEEAIMKQMQNEVARLKTELELSAENEKKLRAEIATKEANFFSGKDMVKVDRRKTWHHMSGDNFQPISLIPRGPIGKATFKIYPSSDSSTPQPDFLKTPREFRIPSCDTPPPMKATTKYRLDRVEKEYSDLQQFTPLEVRFDQEKLEMKIAREEAEQYRQMNCAKLTNVANVTDISNSNGMIEPLSNSGTDSSAIVNELRAAKEKNNELMIQKIAQFQSIFEEEKKNLDQQFKVAKDAREKAEILQIEGEITFEQYKKQTNRRINELISEVESMKLNSIAEPVDSNVSKMPIKVEPENLYELTELKFELDQLKMDRERQRKSIETLQSNLNSLTDEQNVIKSECMEASARNNQIIAELKSQLKEQVEEKYQLQGTIMQCQSDLNSKEQLVVDLEKAISLLKSELAEVKAKLEAEQQQAQQNVQTTIVQLQSDLNDKETAISHLNSELSGLKKQSSGFQGDLKSLQSELQEKQQHLDNSASVISGLRSELLVVNERLQVKQQESQSNDDIVAKLQAELNDKAKNELTAKKEIETLRNQLRSHEKKHSPKSMKMNVNADRKARRYSQGDESGKWLDDSVEAPKIVHSQTDPSDQNCSCESMNEKIVELKQTVAIKTAVINTERLQLKNHPLISKNKDLKKELDEMKAEAELLHKDIDHYKAELQREEKSRECSCRNRVMESKEVQCSEDSDTERHPNIYNLDPAMQLYYAKTVPIKYREANLKIMKLEETNKEIRKKSNFYKELALSRRAEVKRLESELAEKTAAPTSESSNSYEDTEPE